MALSLWFGVLVVVALVAAEEPFCGNQCVTQGVVISRSCHCDFACAKYNDCCADSKYFKRNRNSTAVSRNLLCKRNALTVNSCSEEWKGPDFIIHSCQHSARYEMDPVGSAPVTSDVTGVTYNNYYCAICNGDADSIIVWNIKMSCPFLNPNLPVDREEAFRYIFYNIPTNEWGYVVHDNATNKNSFHGCAITSEIPKPYESKIRPCEGDEIKTCAENWKNDVIREMCGTYTDHVFSNGKRYRNFYCAVCNRANLLNVSCGDAVDSRTNNLPESEGDNKLSFSLLLDINFSEGNSVGKRLAALNCKTGEIFDPFARRCRNIVCGIPGYILENGLCVADVPL